MAVIKTAEEHLKDLKAHERNQERIRKEKERIKALNKAEAEKLEAYEDLRDDLMSAVKNSGMSFEDIHGRCGPHPHTLENWAQKKIRRPMLGKMRSVARIIGLDFGIVSRVSNGR